MPKNIHSFIDQSSPLRRFLVPLRIHVTWRTLYVVSDHSACCHVMFYEKYLASSSTPTNTAAISPNHNIWLFCPSCKPLERVKVSPLEPRFRQQGLHSWYRFNVFPFRVEGVADNVVSLLRREKKSHSSLST